tara:strand:- start:367 stop:1230 length:864 start_codon:yes stop_codon:yes gene_type:complete
MQHPAELALHQYLQSAVNGTSKMSDETIQQICDDMKDAMHRQFGSGKGSEPFRMRMSNVGRPTCQLWFQKNQPEKAIPKPTTFIINMLIGDIVEAVFKGLLKEAGVKYQNSERVKLKIDDDTTVSGEYDLVIDGAVDDVKSASQWSYNNKFDSYESLKTGDAFGYVAQLAGYAKAAAKKAGGWWVVNKANGQFKYTSASGMNVDEEINKIKQTIDIVEKNEFRRCFEPEIETFRSKTTGNKILNKNCTFCDFRFSCWPTLRELPAVKSQAKEPKIVSYVELAGEYLA